ncbi:DNA-dependent metalloprotease WSS1-like [Impatiens glandulifera]|uniref:DNA-dependent metalloprotease WSS1-like n=1 Tax=Impatiens glandulifera TaxID=253017 RepID=UPI001FB15EBB|nr:DNA-dependent metalloprotease WSS1-like [Impatiens glandulifera]
MDVSTVDPYKVWHIKTLRKLREGDAREILENVAKQVQPIMSKHKWRVPILSEFCHPKSSLLGLNVEKGVEIKIRLRRPENELEFLPYNQILQTMLHELCHNDYRHHSPQFYQLLELIKQECDEVLVVEGIKASMQQLGLNNIDDGVGVGVGVGVGFSSNLLTDAGEMLPDDVWCELLLSKSLVTDEGSSSGSSSLPLLEPPKPSTGTTTHMMIIDKMWECSICTLHNKSEVVSCEACGIPREGDEWCEKKVWCCKFCTLNNSIKVERCLLCGEWRYSYGM